MNSDFKEKFLYGGHILKIRLPVLTYNSLCLNAGDFGEGPTGSSRTMEAFVRWDDNA